MVRVRLHINYSVKLKKKNKNEVKVTTVFLRYKKKVMFIITDPVTPKMGRSRRVE